MIPCGRPRNPYLLAFLGFFSVSPVLPWAPSDDLLWGQGRRFPDARTQQNTSAYGYSLQGGRADYARLFVCLLRESNTHPVLTCLA